MHREEHDDEVCIEMTGLKKRGIFPREVFPRDWLHLDGKVTSIPHPFKWFGCAIVTLQFATSDIESFVVVLRSGGSFGRVLSANIFKPTRCQTLMNAVRPFSNSAFL